MIGARWANNQYFTPKHLPNLQLWLDATDVNANSTNPADNTAIASWTDKSGKGNSADQATGANQPFFRTSGINSKPAIQFTGSPVFLNCKTSATLGIKNSAFEFYFVAKTTTLTPTFLISSTSTNNLWEIDFQPSGAGGAQGIGCFNPFPTIQAFVGVGDQYTDGNPHIISYRAETGGSHPNYARADGVDGSVGSNGYNNTDATIIFGRRGSGSFYLVGHIGEIIIVNTTLTTNQRTVLENYLKNKWGTP